VCIEHVEIHRPNVSRKFRPSRLTRTFDGGKRDFHPATDVFTSHWPPFSARFGLIPSAVIRVVSCGSSPLLPSREDSTRPYESNRSDKNGQKTRGNKKRGMIGRTKLLKLKGRSACGNHEENRNRSEDVRAYEATGKRSIFEKNEKGRRVN
jgi:hypothetical protein